MPPTTVFLDVDGVLVDAVKLPQEYVRLMGDVLAPALGGTPEDWGRANAVVFPRVWAENKEWSDDPDELNRHVGRLNIQGMAEHLGIEPPDDDTCMRLDDDFHRHVRGTGDFFFDASAAVVRALAGSYDIHTASGNTSWLIDLMLKRLGVRELVGLPFGSDLVSTRKGSPDFYPRIFERAGTDPGTALVVDDDPHQLALATELGAATVLVRPDPSEASTRSFDAVITEIGQLPTTICAL